MQKGNNRIEIHRWVDIQADRVMNKGRGVAETEVKLGSYGPVQHFESDYHLIIDTNSLTQEMSHARATSEASCEFLWTAYLYASRLRLITLTLEAPPTASKYISHISRRPFSLSLSNVVLSQSFVFIRALFFRY